MVFSILSNRAGPNVTLNLILLQALLVLPLANAFCGSRLPHIHHKVMHKRQTEEGETIEAPRFSYDTTTGPLFWHLIDQEFALCGNGSAQSPIILDTFATTKAPEASVQLTLPKAANVKFENLGTTVEVAAAGTLKTGDDASGVTWELAQFHFHTPSEHRIDLEHFDGEMHMVFKDAANEQSIAVVAFPLETHDTRTTDVLEQVFAKLPDIQQLGQSVEIPELDFTGLMRSALRRSFFRYTGSLTTPPCSEGVQWYVATRALKLNANTFQALKRTVRMNNRFTQAPVQTENVLQLAVKSFAAQPSGEAPVSVSELPEETVANEMAPAEAEAAPEVVERGLVGRARAFSYSADRL